jgi:hypothetical protein
MKCRGTTFRELVKTYTFEPTLFVAGNDLRNNFQRILYFLLRLNDLNHVLSEVGYWENLVAAKMGSFK